MPLQSTITRVNRIQFFSVLTPGFYLVCVVVFAVIVVFSESPQTCITQAKGIPEVLWVPATLFALLSSYMFGSVPRAFSVSRTDDLCEWLFYSEEKIKNMPDGWHKRLHSGLFPYAKALEHQHDLLKLTALKDGTVDRSTHDIQMPPRTNHDGIATFDYWKVFLHVNAPQISELMESLEARARFFVGMFWASVFGLPVGVFLFVVSFWRNGWLPWTIFFSLTTILFAIVFGRRLRSARGEEARIVFFAYLECVGRVGDNQVGQKMGPVQFPGSAN